MKDNELASITHQIRELVQTELFDQTVRIIKNCDDTCVDIKEEYQKELTVFAQCSDKNLTDIRNALLRLDTETSSVATAADGTTVDSAGSREVDDTHESVSVPVAKRMLERTTIEL